MKVMIVVLVAFLSFAATEEMHCYSCNEAYTSFSVSKQSFDLGVRIIVQLERESQWTLCRDLTDLFVAGCRKEGKRV